MFIRGQFFSCHRTLRGRRLIGLHWRVSDMRGKWIPVTVGFVLVALAVALVTCRGRRHPAPPPRAAATAAAIAVAQNEVTLQGKIRPRHVTSAGPAVSGFIEAFLVEPGADVYEGQVLARIGAQGLESAREVAQTALERAQEQVSKAEAEVTAAQLELMILLPELLCRPVLRNSLRQIPKCKMVQEGNHSFYHTPGNTLYFLLPAHSGLLQLLQLHTNLAEMRKEQ